MGVPEVVPQLVGHHANVVLEREDVTGRPVEDDGARAVPVHAHAVVRQGAARPSAREAAAAAGVEAGDPGVGEAAGVALAVSTQHEVEEVEDAVAVVIVAAKVEAGGIEPVEHFGGKDAVAATGPVVGGFLVAADEYGIHYVPEDHELAPRLRVEVGRERAVCEGRIRGGSQQMPREARHARPQGEGPLAEAEHGIARHRVVAEAREDDKGAQRIGDGRCEAGRIAEGTRRGGTRLGLARCRQRSAQKQGEQRGSGHRPGAVEKKGARR